MDTRKPITQYKEKAIINHEKVFKVEEKEEGNNIPLSFTTNASYSMDTEDSCLSCGN